MEPIIRIDSDGLFKWDVITTYFDQDGVIQAKITAFDDGSQREDLYAGGVLDRVVTTDADIASGGASLYDWETITVYYGPDGSKVADETIYDGEWDQDRRQGEGTILSREGQIASGDFRAGQMEGKLTYQRTLSQAETERVFTMIKS